MLNSIITLLYNLHYQKIKQKNLFKICLHLIYRTVLNCESYIMIKQFDVQAIAKNICHLYILKTKQSQICVD
jgi:hypothetical protein